MKKYAVLCVISLCLAMIAAPVFANGQKEQAASSSGNVTLTWWHNGTADPLKGVWQKVADDYHAAHPNVTITPVPIQNEQFNTKMPLALQSNDPPDIYQQWGGGQLATQIKSGKVADITNYVSSWIGELGGSVKGWQVNGKQYGIPFDLHIVGFWYRKDLFAKAGISAPPKTMDELNADVVKLKAAGIAPIAIGSKDRWPDAFYWEYFAVREASTAVLQKAMDTQDLSAPAFIKAGEDMQKFLDSKPFQEGFLGTPAQQGAGSSAGLVANGKAAMELQGDWDLSVMTGLTTDKDLASKLGWFPFPQVAGGAGDPTTTLGGGDGFSVTTKNAAAGADFLKYISSPAVQKMLVENNIASIPVNPAATSSISNPVVQSVAAYSGAASFIQTYFDIALPTNPGQALDSAVADFFAGQGTPQSVAESVAKANQ